MHQHIKAFSGCSTLCKAVANTLCLMNVKSKISKPWSVSALVPPPRAVRMVATMMTITKTTDRASTEWINPIWLLHSFLEI